MSKALKKIGRGIKKRFKSAVKIVKKVASSKIFKAVAIAVAVYFTAGAAMGAMGTTAAASGGAAATGAGAATTATAGATAASTAGATVGAGAAATGAATTGAAVTGAGAATVGSTVTTAGLTSAANTAISRQLVYSAALNAVSNIASDAAARDEQRRYDRQLTTNNSTYLSVGEDLTNLNSRYLPETPSVGNSGNLLARTAELSREGTQAVASTNSLISRVPKVVNTEASSARYYDSSTNSWRN